MWWSFHFCSPSAPSSALTFLEGNQSRSTLSLPCSGLQRKDEDADEVTSEIAVAPRGERELGGEAFGALPSPHFVELATLYLEHARDTVAEGEPPPGRLGRARDGEAFDEQLGGRN